MNRYSGDLGRDGSSDDLFKDVHPEGEGDDPDGSILGKFAKRWEDASGDRARAGLLDEFCGSYPHLRDDIRELVEALHGIGRLISVDTRKAPDPERLGPYKILRLLACGGMGRVYEARDGTLPRRLAVKTIRGDRGSVSRLLGRFQSECRALARLHHTNIIPIYSAGEEDGLLYFAMPLIRGPSLEDLVVTMVRSGSSAAGASTWEELIDQATRVSSRRRSIGCLTNGRGVRAATASIGRTDGPRPEAGDGTPSPASPDGLLEALERPRIRHRSRRQLDDHFRRMAEIVAIAAEAIHSAHEVGVLHFDIKPSNILIEPSDEPGPEAGDGTPPRIFRDGPWKALARAGRWLTIPNGPGQRQGRPRIRVHPWVIDFGLANPVGAEENGQADHAVGVEGGTRRKGTRGFMAPEMLATRDAAGPAPGMPAAPGPHTDVWGLGVTLYQLLTLHLPFDTERGYDTRLMSWGDGSGVPTSGRNLIIIATDHDGVLHIRIFDASGMEVADTDETRLPATQAEEISALKRQLPGLLPPHVLTAAEKSELVGEATSIVGRTHEQAVLDPRRRPTPPREYGADLPRELEAIVLKALQKPIDDRYTTAAALAEDLRRWLAGFPTVAGGAGPPRRMAMWARRRPAAAFAAGMTAAFVIACLLGAGQAVRSHLAEARAAEKEALVAEQKADAAEQAAQANQREHDLSAVSRLRAPIRPRGWFDTAWAKMRALTAGRPDEDDRLQPLSAALLDGLDTRLAKSFEKDASMLAFAPRGDRLLMGLGGWDARKRPATRVVMGELASQQGPTEKIFGSFGVLGFNPGGTASFLEIDADDPSLLRLRDATTGDEKRLLKSPRTGRSKVISLTLSRDGSRAAGVVWPIRERTPEEKAAAVDDTDKMIEDGETATLVVWDADTGRVLRSIEDKQTPTYDVSLSPDGSLLAAWDASGRHHEVSVWGVAGGTLVDRFSSGRTAITSVAFGRDPAWRAADDGPSWRLAVGEHGGKITVWDLRTRAVKCIARGSLFDVKALDFSPDGALLASAGRDFLMIWDAASGGCLLRVPAGGYRFAVAFSPDGRRLATAGTTAFTRGGVEVLDLDEGRGLRTLRGLGQRIEKVAISADGRRVAALSNDWEVGVFDLRSGDLLGVADGPEGFFTDNAALALNGDGSRLACSGGTEAKLWDVGAGRLLRSWTLPPALTEAAGFGADGRLLLIRQETGGKKLPPFGGVDPRAHPRVCRAYRLPERGDADLVSEITDLNLYVEHIAATPDAAYFVVQGNGTSTGELARMIRLHDGSTGKRVGSIPTSIPPDDRATGMRFDPGGTRLVVLTRARSPVDLFEVPSLKPLGPLEVLGSVNVGASRGVRYDGPGPDATGPGMVVLSDRARPRPLLRIARDVDVTGSEGMKFSRDGNYIVWGNQDGTVTVCDLNEVQRRLAGVGLGW